MKTTNNPTNPNNKKILHCAIYTRKSHEEGLEQDFNSLDAQREAAEAYIKSQQHEGWVLLDDKYDDGGFSGGNLKRPALVRLLSDIDYGKIDIVVVYKVDRLSRSLADFSRLIEDFDEKDVSFVSVTQQFNTSSSMGRLTLNVLLSFAQFEREVTSERIRDKIGASKKKGMWMGGNPPMGYQVMDRKLIIIPEESETVRSIFSEYINHGSLINLADDLTERGITTKQWISQTGKQWGGKRITPKYLYRILTNPVYIGQIVHRSETYPGLHQSIIDQSVWDQVLERIQSQSEKSQNYQQKAPYLLKGKLRHYQGYAMSPSRVKRTIKRQGKGNKKEKTIGQIKKRYIRYYVSQKAIQDGYRNCTLKTINAKLIEQIVTTTILHHLKEYLDQQQLEQFFKQDQIQQHKIYRKLIDTVILSPDSLTISLNRHQMDDLAVEVNQILPDETDSDFLTTNIPTLLYQPQVAKNRNTIILKMDIQIKKLDGRRFILTKEGKDLIHDSNKAPNQYMVEAIGKAHYWKGLLEAGRYKTVKTMAKKIKSDYDNIRKRLPLTTLAPDIQQRALSGKLPERITVKQLIKASNKLDWKHQRSFLGF